MKSINLLTIIIGVPILIAFVIFYIDCRQKNEKEKRHERLRNLYNQGINLKETSSEKEYDSWKERVVGLLEQREIIDFVIFPPAFYSKIRNDTEEIKAYKIHSERLNQLFDILQKRKMNKCV